MRGGEFHLELHPDKTRLLAFGRTAKRNRGRRGEGSPETFGFLGFTHCCSRNRKGHFTVLRKTERRRMHAKLAVVKTELRARLHHASQK